MIDTIIKNAHIITMDDLCPVIDGGAVAIDGAKIVFVGNSIELPPEYSTAKRVIDAHGDIVMPGLVNAHAHTAMCVMRGYADDLELNKWLFEKIFPVEGRLTREAVLAGVRLGIAEMLASGTTSFSDMYSNEPNTAKIVAETGIRASLSNGIIALGDGFRFETDRATVETLELIKTWHNYDGGRIRADASIHAEYTSTPDVWKRIGAIAREHGLITHIHLCETKKEYDECKLRHGGLSPVEALARYGVFNTPVLAAHGCYLSDDDIRILADKGVSIAHCPVSNLKLASGIANISKLVFSGVNVCLGTDGSASNNSLDLFEEIKLAALLSKGTTLDPTRVNARQALAFATVNGAKAQGREGVTGRIAASYDADIIMLDTHSPAMQPLYDPCSSAVYSAKGSCVKLTMVRGRILYENGEWKSIDVEKAMHNVNSVAVPIVRGQ